MVRSQSRVDAGNHGMPTLTGLRGLAALWVVVYHAWVYAVPREILVSPFDETIRVHVFFSLGWAGVQILFVLSAFLLTLPYARANAGLRKRPRVYGYLLKRVARVFPAYYLQLILLISIAWLLSHRLPVNSSNVVQYLLMLFVPPPIGIGGPSAVNGVWWTLPIELSFYLLLPLITWLASWEMKVPLLLASLTVMAGWRYFVVSSLDPSQHSPMWMYQLPGSMDSFGLGMLGAVIHVHYCELGAVSRVYRRTLVTMLCLTPIAFTLLGVWIGNEFATYWTYSTLLFLWTLLFSTTILIVILNCAQGVYFLNKLLGNGLVFYLGTISYGLYLWHAPIGKWLKGSPLISDMQSYQFPRLALIMLLLSVIAASLSWFVVESKAIKLARKL